MMLSLPEDWNYTTRGMAKICKEGVDAIGGALRELETAGYIVRHQLRDRQGRISDTGVRHLRAAPAQSAGYAPPGYCWPRYGFTRYGNPYLDKPDTEKPAELNIRESKPKNQIPRDQVPIPFPSGQLRRPGRRNGKDGMRCRWKKCRVIGIWCWRTSSTTTCAGSFRPTGRIWTRSWS